VISSGDSNALLDWIRPETMVASGWPFVGSARLIPLMGGQRVIR